MRPFAIVREVVGIFSDAGRNLASDLLEAVDKRVCAWVNNTDEGVLWEEHASDEERAS